MRYSSDSGRDSRSDFDEESRCSGQDSDSTQGSRRNTDMARTLANMGLPADLREDAEALALALAYIRSQKKNHQGTPTSASVPRLNLGGATATAPGGRRHSTGGYTESQAGRQTPRSARTSLSRSENSSTMDGLRIRHKAILGGLVESGEGQDVMTPRRNDLEAVRQRHKACLENMKKTLGEAEYLKVHNNNLRTRTKNLEEHARREESNRISELEEQVKKLTEENEKLKEQNKRLNEGMQQGLTSRRRTRALFASCVA